MSAVRFQIVDSLAHSRAPGATRKCGDARSQRLAIRCPACARPATFAIAPNLNANGFVWTASMSARGFCLDQPLQFPCCGWAGELKDGAFRALPAAVDSGELTPS